MFGLENYRGSWPGARHVTLCTSHVTLCTFLEIRVALFSALPMVYHMKNKIDMFALACGLTGIIWGVVIVLIAQEVLRS